MNLFLNKIKAEKKKKNRNFDKIKELNIERVKNKYVNNPKQLETKLKN